MESNQNEILRSRRLLRITVVVDEGLGAADRGLVDPQQQRRRAALVKFLWTQLGNVDTLGLVPKTTLPIFFSVGEEPRKPKHSGT
jgi:hypothetical protein